VKLSIIVPVYNAEKFLDKCLESLKNQTIKDIEIILVNDGSTDNSLEICNKYAQNDSRIKVLTQKNSGQSKARNVGIDNSNGEYIAFTDSDDWVDLDYYGKLVEACEKHDAEVACASIIRERKYSKKYRMKYTEELSVTDEQEKIDVARVPNMCYVSNKVYKKALLERLNLRFIEGMFFEDVDFVTRAVYFSNKLVTVPNTFYHYWTNFNSTVKTMRKNDKKCADALRSKELLLKFFREHNLKSNPKFLIRKKTCYKLFGFVILKTYEWESKKVYYLFGAIPILEQFSYA
jgi:glycosyltransferase involved in cell wall biosynthesis